MTDVDIKRNGRTNQFSIVLVQGTDTIRCMVSVAFGGLKDARSDEEKKAAALRKAKALARALDSAIRTTEPPSRPPGEDLKGQALARWNDDGGASATAKRSKLNG